MESASATETFRDENDHRFGLSLGDLEVTRAERLERILPITALGLYYVLRIPWRLEDALRLIVDWTDSENWG